MSDSENAMLENNYELRLDIEELIAERQIRKTKENLIHILRRRIILIGDVSSSECHIESVFQNWQKTNFESNSDVSLEKEYIKHNVKQNTFFSPIGFGLTFF